MPITDPLTNNAYGLGLASLYRQVNPAERRVQIESKVAENSGFAKPLIYAMMGKDMGNAEQWDTEHEATVKNVMAAQQKHADTKEERQAVQKTLEIAIKALSEGQPAVATRIMEIEAGRNPAMAPYKGIQWNTPMMKNGDARITTAGDGQQWLLNVPKAARIMEEEVKTNGVPEDADATMEVLKTAGAAIPIGSPKDAKAEKGIEKTVDLGDRVEYYRPGEAKPYKTETKGRVPKERGGGEETPQEKAYGKLEKQYQNAIGNFEKEADAAGMSAHDRNRRIQSIVDQYEPAFQRHGMSVKAPWERGGSKVTPASSSSKAFVPDGKGGYVYQ